MQWHYFNQHQFEIEYGSSHSYEFGDELESYLTIEFELSDDVGKLPASATLVVEECLEGTWQGEQFRHVNRLWVLVDTFVIELDGVFLLAKPLN